MPPRTVKFYLETVATGDGITRTRGQLEELDNKVQGMGARLGKLSEGFRNVGGSLMTAGRGMTQFATIPIAGAFAVAMKSASDLNEQISKVNTVFGESAQSIQDFASHAAKNFGLSRKAALEATGTFGNMFSQLGIGERQTAAWSQSMTAAASDLASFHNADITEVIEAQTAAFRGEYDALQRYIPTINAAAVQQKAMEQTGKANADQLNDTEKAAATYTLMMEGMGAAQGDFARTSDSAANRQRILKARFEDLASSIGNMLLPIAIQVGEILAGWLDRFNALSPTVQKFILIGAGVVAVLGPIVGAAGALLTVLGLLISPVGLVIAAIAGLAIGVVYAYNRFEGFREVVDTVVSWFRDTAIPALLKAGDWIMEKFQVVKEWWDGFWPKLSEAVGHFSVVIQAVVGFLVDMITALWTRFGDNILSLVVARWNMIYDTIAGVMGVIRGVIEFFVAIINGEWGQAWQAIKDIFSNIWQIILAQLTYFLSILQAAIGLAWEVIKTTVSNAWNWIRDVVLAPIGNWLQTNVIDKFWAMVEGIRLAMNAVWGFITDIWGSIMATVRGAINGVIGFINTLIRGINAVLSKIPGIDIQIGEIGQVFAGGGASAVSQQFGNRMASGGRIGAGFRTNGPRAIVGEGHPSYPEYVVPTDPRHRSRALSLFGSLGSELIPGLQFGGILNAGKSFIGGLVSGAGGMLGGLARKALEIIFSPVNAAVKAGLNTVPNVLHVRDMAQSLREAVWSWVQGADSGLPEAPPPGAGGTARGSGLFGLHEPVASMAAKVLALGRGMISIISGWRSRQQQEVLYARYLAGTGNLAAPPGTSKHERGLAVDWGGNRSVYQSLWRSVGGHFPVRGEPWHGEAIGYRWGGIADKAGYTHPGEAVLTRADQLSFMKMIRGGKGPRTVIVEVHPGAVVIQPRPGREGEQDGERAAKRFLDVIAQRRVLTDARIA